MQVIDSVSEASPQGANEDLFASGATWAFVLDGAGRYPGEPAGCVHAITWIVEHLGKHIGDGLEARRLDSIADIVRDAIKATMADHGDTCDLNDPLSPGAAGVVVRFQSENLEWFVIGDCAAVIEKRNANYLAIIDDRVDNLPNAPVTDSEVRTYTPDFVRQVRNKPDGFWVLGAVPAAADHALTGTESLANVNRLLLCSDGISRLAERFAWPWSAVFTAAESGGAKALIEAVRTAELSDPDPRRWRGKRHDDATAALLA